MSKKITLSKEQYMEFEKKLEYLEKVALPKNSESIAAAVAQGDLSENAEYDIAKEEQAKLHQEIAKIKNILGNASILKQNDNTDYVETGHKVTIKALDSNVYEKEVETVTLMSFGDGTTSISIDAPLGSVLLGKKVGEIVVVETPKVGELRFEILKIELSDNI